MISECYNHHCPLKKKKNDVTELFVFEDYFEFADSKGEFQMLRQQILLHLYRQRKDESLQVQ